MEFEDVVRRRRMVRNYTGEPVGEASIGRIMRLARRAPSAGFSQGQSFVVVTDSNLRSAIASLAGEDTYVKQGFDPWVSRAGALVVCCISEGIYHERYREPDKVRRDGTEIDWPVPYWWIDGGCSMMLLLLATVDEGLSAGFLGLDADAYRRLKELLRIPESVEPFGIVTIGHSAPDRRSGSLARGWRDERQVVHMQTWGGTV